MHASLVLMHADSDTTQSDLSSISFYSSLSISLVISGRKNTSAIFVSSNLVTLSIGLRGRVSD